MTAPKVEPLTEEEVAHRKEVATEMLLKWRAEKPINARRADLKEMAIHRYEDELRMIATIAAIRAENAELRGRALDDAAICLLAANLIGVVKMSLGVDYYSRNIRGYAGLAESFARNIREEIAKRKDAGKEPTNV